MHSVLNLCIFKSV